MSMNPTQADFAALLDESLGGRDFMEGQVVHGKVVAIEKDIAIIDVMMPGHDGLWLATRLRRDHPHTAVVIATGHSGMLAGEAPETTTSQHGIADFLIKPLERERFELAVDRGRQWRKETLDERRWHAKLAFELRDCLLQLVADQPGFHRAGRDACRSARDSRRLTEDLDGPRDAASPASDALTPTKPPGDLVTVHFGHALPRLPPG